MKVLIVTGDKYLPQMKGGLQSSADQLCHALLSRGHRLAVLAGLMPNGWLGYKAYAETKVRKFFTGLSASKDYSMGSYPVWRARIPWESTEGVVRLEKPDAAIVLSVRSVPMALSVQKAGVPFLMNFQDVEFQAHGGDLSKLGSVHCVANSAFTASRYAAHFPVSPTVIHPIIDEEKYRVSPRQEKVLFISPTPRKGLDIALKVASLCPDIPFLFVESGPLEKEMHDDLLRKLEHLPNVTFIKAQSDMRPVYEAAKILIVPSLWEEAYGRVAAEAIISGIPVIAYRRGGLPEAVGKGGILLPADASAEDWAERVRELWSKGDMYRHLSEAAYTESKQPLRSTEHKGRLWEQALNRLLNSSNNRLAP